MKMALRVIKCEEPTIACFLRKITEEGFGTLTSLENCKDRHKAIVLGKLIRFINIKPEEKYVHILVREILPDGIYGTKFKAIIKKNLCLQVINAGLHMGDRLGFFEPCISENLEVQSQVDVRFVLQIGENKQPVMWYARKHHVLAKLSNLKDASTKVQDKEMINEDTRSNGSTTNNQNNLPDIRQKPQIQLPINPQIPSNIQRLNPRYVYKNLAKVKTDALLGDLRRVNIIAVVVEITKGLAKTATGKYTIICKLIDDSVAFPGELVNFNLHFFIQESTIINKIEQGDILRLHRVKLELYMNDVDGRIFNSQDIVLFKKNSTELKAICIFENINLSDEDKRKILVLKKWYKEDFGTYLNLILEDITLLSSIQKEGEYNLVCKVISKPVVEDSKITLSVSDGSVMGMNAPRPSCHTNGKYDLPDSTGHLVTDIEVFERLSEYSKIKIDDYVFLRSVKATKLNELLLTIPTFVFPMVLEFKVDKVLQVESRLKVVTKAHSLNTKETSMCDTVITEEMQQIQHVPQNTDLEQERQVILNCQKCAVKYKSNIKKTRSLSNKLSPNCTCNNPQKCAIMEIGKGENSNMKSPGNKHAETIKEPCAQKMRKPLFTANYMDLSDATDEMTEVVDQVREVVEKAPSQMVVSSGNVSMENLIELVKTKYCSPRKLPSTLNSAGLHHHGNEGNKSTDLEQPSTTCKQSAMVKLVKLTDDECIINDKQQGENKRKNGINESDFHCLQEDVSTVVNLSLECTENQKNKKLKLEPYPSRYFGDAKNKTSRAPEKIIAHKVSHWLSQNEDKEVDDVSTDTVHQIMFDSEHQEVDDMALCISSQVRRVQVFLIEVIPDPTKEPLDLVSGYCFEGCQQLFLFSTIHWKEIDSQTIPFCPNCKKTQLIKKLELIFMLQLHVMDRKGNHESMLVCREHGDTFFGCSVMEYLAELAVRRSRVQLLLDNTIVQFSRPGFFNSPLLDLSIVAVSNIFCVINTKLKLPPNP